MRNYITVAVLTAAFMVAMVDRVVLSLLVDPIQRDLGMTDTEFGLLNGVAFALFYLFLSIPIGRLADRHSRRVIITTGALIWSAMTAMCGLARTPLQLFVARFGVGAGESALTPSAYSMMADLFPRDQLGRVYAIFGSGALVGFGLSFLLGGWAIGLAQQNAGIAGLLPESLHGWQKVFIIAALPGLLIATACFLLREPVRHVVPGKNTSAPASGFWPFVVENKRFIGAYLVAFGCLGSALYGALGWLPAMLTRVYGMDRPTVGLLLGIGVGIASPIGAICGGIINDSLLRKGRGDAALVVGLLGALGALPLFLMIGWAMDWRITLALICALFFFLSLPTAMGPAGVQAFTPPTMLAQMTAFYVVATGLAGMSIGNLLIGFFTDHVFQNKAAVGQSIALFGCIVSPIMATVFYRLRGGFTVLTRANWNPEPA